MPPLLRLPYTLSESVRGRTMKIDPEARSSLEDCARPPPSRHRRRDHRNRRPARTGMRAVAPHRGADQKAEAERQARPADAGTSGPEWLVVLKWHDLGRLVAPMRRTGETYETKQSQRFVPLPPVRGVVWSRPMPRHPVDAVAGYDARPAEQRAAAPATTSEPACAGRQTGGRHRAKQTHAH